MLSFINSLAGNAAMTGLNEALTGIEFESVSTAGLSTQRNGLWSLTVGLYLYCSVRKCIGSAVQKYQLLIFKSFLSQNMSYFFADNVSFK